MLQADEQQALDVAKKEHQAAIKSQQEAAAQAAAQADARHAQVRLLSLLLLQLLFST